MKNLNIIQDTIKSVGKEKGLDGLESTSIQFLEEKLTAFLQVKLKPSEKEAFLSLIERRSASSEVRKLILDFIKNK